MDSLQAVCWVFGVIVPAGWFLADIIMWLCGGDV